MKARLFQSFPDSRCAKVRKLLEFKGIDYETIEVDLIRRDEVISLSGQITLPLLHIPESNTLVANADSIVTHLELAFPNPTLLPPTSRGLHQALNAYLDGAVERVLFALAWPDLYHYYQQQGPLQASFFEHLSQRKYGQDPSSLLHAPRASQLVAVHDVLAPFDQALENRAFLLGRLGLADFALYAQLWPLNFTGTNQIPGELVRLRSLFDRIDRLSASLDLEATLPGGGSSD
ncbi:MAG TPA: glutathione S-transferase family protein [Candidatus Binataceae bacterium]|nr:glutathione S-transferase family protein [Candidatus Binataceae bacterium]